MIAVIDYKAGNLTSVVKALHFLGAREVVVTPVSYTHLDVYKRQLHRR